MSKEKASAQEQIDSAIFDLMGSLTPGEWLAVDETLPGSLYSVLKICCRSDLIDIQEIDDKILCRLTAAGEAVRLSRVAILDAINNSEATFAAKPDGPALWSVGEGSGLEFYRIAVREAGHDSKNAIRPQAPSRLEAIPRLASSSGPIRDRTPMVEATPAPTDLRLLPFGVWPTFLIIVAVMFGIFLAMAYCLAI